MRREGKNEQMRSSSPISVVIVLVALVLSACSDAASTQPGENAASTQPDENAASAQPGKTVERPEGCESPTGTPWAKDESVDLELIGEQDGLMVYAAEYPLPGPTEGLWSQWGQGVALGDGRHISAVGDSLGVKGNSWFFLYDNADRSLTRLFDVLSVVPYEQGAWGYGKIHAQMVADECGSIWAATYWGSRKGITYDKGYEGDRLLELDPIGETVTDHGVFAQRRGTPTMVMSTDGRTLVAAAVDAETDTAVIASYDTRAHSLLDPLDDPRQIGFRSLAPSDSGAILYSIGGGALAAYDPDSETARDIAAGLPGDWLRASSGLLEDGSSFGVTQDRPEMFSLAADGKARSIGDPQGYTTSLAMSDGGDELFWLPNAHGGAWEVGAAILTMDTETSQISELVRLGPMFEESLGLRAGGAYSIVYDQGRLILGVNASPLADDSGFGTVVLVVVERP